MDLSMAQRGSIISNIYKRLIIAEHMEGGNKKLAMLHIKKQFERTPLPS